MHSMKALSFVLGLTVLTGCNNGQPRIFRMVLDDTALANVPVTCRRGNATNVSTFGTTLTGYRDEQEWVIWDGIEGKQFLDMGTPKFALGDAPLICVLGLIEGSDKTFTGSRKDVYPYGDYSLASGGCVAPGFKPGSADRNKAQEIRETGVTVAFNDLGASPSGSITMRSTYRCVGECPVGDQMASDAIDCNLQMNFSGRRVEVQNVTNYDNKL